MTILAMGYAAKQRSDLSRIRGGKPYGSTTIAGLAVKLNG